VPYRPFAGQNCSIAATLAIVGERWTLLVMREVLLGRRRFLDIKRHTGIAGNILSDRLNTLVEQGLLRRRLYSEHPESYEYLPTERGRDLNPVLVELMRWGDRHVFGQGREPRVLVHATCGGDANPMLVCGNCHEVIDAADLRVRPGPGADEQQRLEPLLPVA
jgi:DNA-binding HxlR family transcriptional regulator